MAVVRATRTNSNIIKTFLYHSKKFFSSTTTPTNEVELLSKDTPIVVVDFNDLLELQTIARKSKTTKTSSKRNSDSTKTTPKSSKSTNTDQSSTRSNELRSKLNSSISTAYGSDGLGILLVKNVPNLNDYRQRCLKMSRKLAVGLDDKYKHDLMNKESFYNVGWSHGVEKLKDNIYDLRKGSFYANPLTDNPLEYNKNKFDNKHLELGKLVKQYPEFYYPNVWPINTDRYDRKRNAFGRQYKQHFVNLGTLIYNVGSILSYSLDLYVQKELNKIDNGRNINDYIPGTITNVVRSDVPKGRLLYYFGEQEYKDIVGDDNNQNIDISDDMDSWCAWHTDHSALTGLALGMFFDDKGKILDKVEDSLSGLYVQSRKGEIVRLYTNEEIASEYLAFQIGETIQILSGGILCATPHAVEAPGKDDDGLKGAGRSSFALFMQPRHNHHIKCPNISDVSKVQHNDNLAQRWNNDPNDTFGQFSKRTFHTYH